MNNIHELAASRELYQKIKHAINSYSYDLGETFLDIDWVNNLVEQIVVEVTRNFRAVGGLE